MSNVHFTVLPDLILRKRKVLNAKKEVNFFFIQVLLFLLGMIYCWRESYWENCSSGTELRRPAVKVTHGTVRSKWIYQVIVCITLHPWRPPFQQTATVVQSKRTHPSPLQPGTCTERSGSVNTHHLRRHSPGGKRAATAHVTHREANTRDGKHHMCRVKSLGVALRVVSGIVNHRGAQALQLLPGGGTEGLSLRSHAFSWWLLALLPAINSPSVLHLTSSDTPPLPCLLPFPWLKLHCGVSVVTYRTSILPETLTGSWTIAQWLNTPSEFQSQFFFFGASIHSSDVGMWIVSTSWT